MTGKKVHFTGIKGTGMAALAQILADMDYQVQGSDIEKYIFTQEELQQRGIPFFTFGQADLNDVDLLVAGLSFDKDHPEIVEARSRNIPVLWYNDFLGEFIRQFVSVCVAGCHGKSTTTGMLDAIFSENTKSGVLIGDGHGRIEKESDYFILEACEFQNHFLSYHPDYAIITNIELDHVDFFTDEKDYLDSFQSFVNQIKKGLVINGDDPLCQKLHLPHEIQCKTFGFEPGNDFRIVDFEQGPDGSRFSLIYEDRIVGTIHLKQTGRHFAYDAAAAFALAFNLGLNSEAISRSLENYGGIHRRFEIVEASGSKLVDDYAHHPTAIRYMIESARSRWPDLPVVALYKPDRYSRLQYFIDDFAASLNQADQVFLLDFDETARKENDSIWVSIEDLAERIDHSRIISIDQSSAEELAKHAPAVFLFMSSKNIYLLKDLLNKSLKEENNQ